MDNDHNTLNGKCKWYDKKKGFGVIESGDNKYFVHYSNIDMSKQYLDDEAQVTFVPEYDDLKQRDNAKNVKVVFSNTKQRDTRQRQRNTTNFNPDYNPTALKVKVISGATKKPLSIDSHDVIIVPNLFADPTIMTKLQKEVKDNDVEFKSWHGDSHWIANDKVGNWKDPSCAPVFNHIIETVKNFFNMDVQATRLNWYNNFSEWKPYHHDAAAIKEDKAETQNFTVGISFGATRDVAFEHSTTLTKVSFELPDCYIYAFGKDINIEWKHGIPPRVESENYSGIKERVSIILWGKVDTQ